MKILQEKETSEFFYTFQSAFVVNDIEHCISIKLSGKTHIENVFEKMQQGNFKTPQELHSFFIENQLQILQCKANVVFNKEELFYINYDLNKSCQEKDLMLIFKTFYSYLNRDNHFFSTVKVFDKKWSSFISLLDLPHVAKEK